MIKRCLYSITMFFKERKQFHCRISSRILVIDKYLGVRSIAFNDKVLLGNAFFNYLLDSCSAKFHFIGVTRLYAFGKRVIDNRSKVSVLYCNEFHSRRNENPNLSRLLLGFLNAATSELKASLRRIEPYQRTKFTIYVLNLCNTCRKVII